MNYTYTKSGIQRRVTYEEICKWIVTSWNGITLKCIRNSFKRRKFMNLIRNTFEKSSCDEEDVANLENSSNEVLYYLESFKFYSDEEFNGFNV